MSAIRSDLMRNVSAITIGSQAATIVLPGMKFPQASRIKSVWYTDQVGVVVDVTDNIQIELQDSAGNALADLDTTTTALVANTPFKMAINTLAAQITQHNELLMAAGSYVKVAVTEPGAAVTTLGTLFIEWYPV